MSPNESEFYIGYLPKAPAGTARFTRRWVCLFLAGGLALAIGLAVILPYFGQGEFAFGHPRDFTGVFSERGAPRLTGKDGEYVLVGYGKHAVPREICGAPGKSLTVNGTLIEREGKSLVEVAAASASLDEQGVTAPAPASAPLGSFTLTGEIVDSKCYFGVMNPAEVRAHRACASLCLRGGIPAVFVARDRAGAVVHLIVTGLDEKPMNTQLLRWTGESVQASGEVVRQGKWLVFRVDPASIHLAVE